MRIKMGIKCLYCGSEKFTLNISIARVNENMQDKTLDDLYKEVKEDLIQDKKGVGYMFCADCKTAYNNHTINNYMNAMNNVEINSEDLAYLLSVKFRKFIKREDVYVHDKPGLCFKALNILNEKLNDFDIIEYDEGEYDLIIKYYKDGDIKTFTTSVAAEKKYFNDWIYTSDRRKELILTYNIMKDALRLLSNKEYYGLTKYRGDSAQIIRKDSAKKQSKVCEIFLCRDNNRLGISNDYTSRPIFPTAKDELYMKLYELVTSEIDAYKLRHNM